MRAMAVLAAMMIVGPAAAAAPGQAFSTTVGVDSILESVRRAERDIRDVAFNFTQRTELKGTGEAQEVTGEVLMLRSPDRFRVNYTSPVRQVAVYDGKALTLYLPEAGQAFRQKATIAELDRMLGFNPASMLDAFSGGYTPESRGCEGGRCTLVFRPRDPMGTSWNVAMSAGNWMVEEVSFENGDMKMSIACSGYRLNKGITPKTFRFRLPPDTEVIDGIPMLMGPALGKGGENGPESATPKAGTKPGRKGRVK